MVTRTRFSKIIYFLINKLFEVNKRRTPDLEEVNEEIDIQ